MLRSFLKVLLPLIAISSTAFAEAPQNPEIRVQLTTASSLIPVYMGRFRGETSFDRNYLNQLEDVLQFDLNHNGSTRALPINDHKEKVLKEGLSSNVWKSMGIAHVMKVDISGKALSLALFSSQSGTVKEFKDISLTGELAQDRRQIHKLADAIHKALFNKEGIATSRILFARQAKEVRADNPEGAGWASEIWECDWDGHNPHQITNERSYCVTPVYIPANAKFPGANDRFLYVSYKQGQPKIFLASMKEGVGKRLIDLRGNQVLPAISPQRDKVAFICDASGRSDLFMQSFNPQTGEVGKPVQLFSYPHSTQASPTFSPDGMRVAFVSDKDRHMRIYVIPSTGSGRRVNPLLITKQNSENSCPSWSPDGRKLAYSAKTGGVRQIWVYDFATQEERQLTSGAGNKENPTWAADSLHIAFNSTDASSSELYVVNLNQPEAIRITKGQGKNHYPTWGPR